MILSGLFGFIRESTRPIGSSRRPSGLESASSEQLLAILAAAEDAAARGDSKRLLQYLKQL